MAWKFALFVAIVVIAVIVQKVKIRIQTLTLPPGYSFNDEDCSLIGQSRGLIGSEDLALGRHSIIFVTSGDLFGIFENGVKSSRDGDIWMLDPRPGSDHEPVRVERLGFPEGRLFHPHGFDISNATDRMFAVNHHQTGSSIEVFRIIYNAECAASIPWSCSPARLEHEVSVASEMFPYMGINDVVEVDSDHVYVTRWQVFSFPSGGKKHPSGVMEKLKLFAELPIMMLGLKFTYVYLCSIRDSVCTEASDVAFVGANGMTISQDRSLLFVNDPLEKMITVFKVDKNNLKLTKESVIRLPVAADNIEYDDESDQILIGTIPDITPMLQKTKGGEEIKVPGGLALADRDGQGSGWRVRDVLEHDGSKLSQISAASRFGSTVFLGSPGAEGLLLCPAVHY